MEMALTNPEETPNLRSINPLLLASLRVGSVEALNFLVKREQEGVQPAMLRCEYDIFVELLAKGSRARGRTPMLPFPAPRDVEEGVDNQPVLPAAGPLLKGITSDGDTALHIVASLRNQYGFLDCAALICDRDSDLLFAQNNKGDTPLHCATRNGDCAMITHFIEIAAGKRVLRIENDLRETVLHDAVRFSDSKIILKMMEADPQLACYPREGVSPMYLAVLRRDSSIAEILYEKSQGNLSYSGPNGKNALHRAILDLDSAGMVERLLDWNRSLTAEVDSDGSTPLHFASSLYFLHCSNRSFRLYLCPPRMCDEIVRQVFEANGTPLYQADNKGFFPIHVAASVGAISTIQFFVDKFPDSAGLCNAQGRTFLHVAVLKQRLNIVSFVCRSPSLAWILNRQDNDGNTALHLAVTCGRFRIFCALLGNPEVQLNLTNNRMQTPCAISSSKIPSGMYFLVSNEKQINDTLITVSATQADVRWDYSGDEHSAVDKEAEKEVLGDHGQTIGIGSALIASMAFAACFALPGGYKADDHTNGGTPTLAGRYVFDAFMMATTLAFICSSTATVGIIYSATSLADYHTRRVNLDTCVFLMGSSFTSLSAAFALAVYMVLATVARPTAIVICFISPFIVMYRNTFILRRTVIVARPLYTRLGLVGALVKVTVSLLTLMLIELWPLIVIFGWAALARINQHS